MAASVGKSGGERATAAVVRLLERLRTSQILAPVSAPAATTALGAGAGAGATAVGAGAVAKTEEAGSVTGAATGAAAAAGAVSKGPAKAAASPQFSAGQRQKVIGLTGTMLRVRQVEWAQQAVQKWQKVKAAALGPSHLIGELDTILEGQMLHLWEERAREVKSHGWYWNYNFISMKIESALMSPNGEFAVVEATIQEAARLFDAAQPQHNDSYRSTYTARYHLHRCPPTTRNGGGWKIMGGSLLR
eukprot:TRINITY_DN2766_c0_g3_i2.p1 TRINITY_DN2766_c0_g3~~TRINITY_DN2766_c0_g3_i2.p1  ORF type:complete len:278 (+),score=95.69 TRINITY_DN2766_c0_g3_i2:99-836(+)